MPDTDLKNDRGEPLGYGEMAQTYLALGYYEAKLLFHTEFWPYCYSQKFQRVRSPRKRALIVAQVIDDFITRIS